MYNGIRYQKVSAIVYRMVSGKLRVSAELLDANGNCLVYAPIEKVEESRAEE